MNMNRFVFAAVGAAFFAGCCSQGPVEVETPYAREAMQKYVDSGEISGAICIYYDNGVQSTTCIGYADPEAKRAITVDDVYMQCSQTKGFCGVTIAKLVEDGKISLDDPVSKYLPEFKNLTVRVDVTNGTYRVVPAKNVLTVRMCLNHTGGFGFEVPNYQAMGGWSRRMPLRSVAAVVAGIPLNFEPGTSYQYSNVGIDVGAAVVEKVTGQRWEDYLKENVLDPLGMESSGFWPTDDQLESKIELYGIKFGQPAKWLCCSPSMQRPYNDDRVFSSAGAGLWTTARDQLKFYKMLMNLGVGENGVRILKEETVKSILAVSTRPQGMEGYSLGLIAPVKDGDDQWFGHGGAWCTQCLVNWHKRQLKLLAVQFSGGDGYKFRQINDAAADKFFKTKIDNSALDAYTGRMK